MNHPFRYGILGCGNIAGQFAAHVADAQHSQITAVASRSAGKALAFGTRFGIASEHCHGDYAALLANPNVDAVYVAVPNHEHHNWSKQALAAGKHVLCEKPFVLDVADADDLFATANAAKLRIMEAFMYRCHPLTQAVVNAVQGGAIGQLRMIRASFCYHTTRIDGNVRFEPSFGGGGLQDIGSYCVNFARLMAGEEPHEVHAVGHQHSTGVDDVGAAVLKFPSGVTASLTFGMRVQMDNTAHLGGTDGWIQVPIPWKPPMTDATYVIGGQTPPKQDLANGTATPPGPQTITVDAPAPLFAVEADAFAHAVQNGGPLPVTHADTRGNVAVLSQLAEQLGRSC
ncbi:MAG: Gfo/Idh/MocA family oxidoreductase [Algisphaera sp.]